MLKRNIPKIAKSIDFNKLDLDCESPEQALWLRVITQAIFDAMATPSRATRLAEIKEARDFLRNKDNCFYEICAVIGFKSYDYVVSCAMNSYGVLR